MTIARGMSLILAVLMLLAVIWSTGDRGVAERTQATVIKIVDGDTIKVRDITDHQFTVRIIGIDTPETKHPDLPVQCYGPEASAFAADILAGRSVVLAYNPLGDAEDKYGRTLAYVELLDGTDYGLTAIQQGLARERDYDERYDRQHKYLKAQAAAERELAGLWKECR